MVKLWAALAAAPAPAVSIGAGTARAMIEELAPWIEASEGRAFADLPAVDVASQAFVAEQVLLSSRLAAGPGGEVPATTRDALVAQIEVSLALYVPHTRRIYLLKEPLEDLIREAVADTPIALEVIRCVLVHELTHALQHQYLPGYSEVEAAGRALIEGHAERVEADYLRQLPASTQASVAQLVGLNSYAWGPPPEGELEALYAYGHGAVAALDTAAGREAVWAAMAEPPAEMSLVVASAAPGRVRGWSAPLDGGGLLGGAIGPRLEVLAGAPLEAEEALAGSTLLSGLLAGPGGAPPPLPALGGRMLMASAEGVDVKAVAVMTSAPEVAALAVRLRRGELEVFSRLGARELYFFHTLDAIAPRALRPRPLRAFDDRGDVDEVLRVSAWGYRELWVASEGLLFAIFSEGPRLRPADLEALYEDLRAQVDLAPSPTAPAPEVAAWIERAAGAAASATPTLQWAYRMKRSAARIAAGDAAVCREEGDAALAEAPPDEAAAIRAGIHGNAEGDTSRSVAED